MSYDDNYDEDDAIDVDKEGYDDDEDDESLGSASRTRSAFSSSPSSTSRLPGSGSGAGGYGSRYSSGGNSPSSSGSSTGSTGSYGARYSSGGSGPSSSSSGSSTSSSSGGSGAGGYGSRYSSGGSSPSSSGSSTGSSTGAGSSPSRYGSSGSGAGSGASSSAGSSTSRFSSSSSSSASSSPASSASASSAASGKKDDKGESGGGNPLAKTLGGLTSRFKGGGDDKAAPKSGDSGGGKNAFSNALGGLKGRFGGGGDGKAAPKSGDSGGGKNPFSNALGGLKGRFGGGDKAEGGSKPAASASSSAAGSPSRFGGGSSASSGAGSSAASGGGARFGSAASKPASGGGAAKSDAPAGPGIGDKLRGMFGGFGSKGESKPSTREKAARAERASKAPKVDRFGLSLDNWLDIIGVALVLGALALTFSSASATKGQLTEAVNTFLSQLVGVGAIAVPIAMFAVGLWLIVRHFGEDAPVVDPVRLVGIGLLYISLLVALQYYDSIYSMYTLSLLDAFLELSIEAGRGGGWVGAQVYRLLVLNITEIGGVFVVLGMMFISAMLILRISAADIAVFVISLWRSFMDAQRRRAQQREVEARQQAARLAAAAQSTISVTKPEVAELPGETSPALPAGANAALPEPREIPITMGGRTVSASLGGEDASASSNEAIPIPLPVEPAANPSLASRFFGAIPGRNKPDVNAPAELSPVNKPAGSGAMAKLGRFGAVGGLLKRGKSDEAENATPAATSAASATGTNAPAASTPAASETPVTAGATQTPAAASPVAPVTPTTTTSTGPVTATAQSSADTPADPVSRPSVAASTATPSTEEVVPRISDLMADSPSSRTAQPATSSEPAATAQPYNRYAAAKPVTPEPAQSALPAEADEDSEDLSKLPPASPKGTARVSSIYGTGETPAASAATPTTPPAKSVTDDVDEADDDDEQLNRSSRLDQLRQGQFKNAGVPSTGGTPSASPASTGSASAAYPSDRISPRTTPSVSSPTPDVGSTAPAASTQQPLRSTTPSPAYGRPAGPPATPAPSSSSGKRRNWSLPDYKGLLYAGSETDFDRESLLKRARNIEETLVSFGAPGRVVEVNTGPVITQFGVEPDYLENARSGKKTRVKVGAIAQLDKDLQLALGAKSIRIEAPVPGKGYVGIEVPNEEASLVSLRDVMESENFQKLSKKSPLAIGLGQSVDGTPISADLATMPHLLIAGTTGSGKSVCVNAIIASILLMNPPDKVKFIMVDPKRVELTGYNGIPHLVAPVVVDLERTVGVLKWVTREMDDRYKKFSNAASRNIVDYNRNLSDKEEPMPYIVVIIDELADLMMLAPDETERVITRIAAMARATGIHLVIATQRPSVDVVTGLIKANFPARIAFAVAGGVDSRVILDQPGAERLLGRGDMLYLSGDSPAALRLQGVYVSDAEIDNITRYWRQVGGDAINTRPISAFSGEEEAESARPVSGGNRFSSGPVSSNSRWDSEPLFADDDDDDDDLPSGDDRDELYDQAVEMVRRNKKASVSMLQRKLRIGYTRAARLIDTMEEAGIVGPAKENSSKPRDVLVMD